MKEIGKELKKFEDAYRFTAKWEGGLSDHPNDAGGITNYGISIVFLREFVENHRTAAKSFGLPKTVTADTIRNLTRQQAREIFHTAFWEKCHCHLYSPSFAATLFDAAVNSGPARATRWAQTACNSTGLSINIEKKPLVVDGALGPKTKDVFLFAGRIQAKASIEARRSFLQNLALSNPSQKVFLKGWLNRVNDLSQFISTLED